MPNTFIIVDDSEEDRYLVNRTIRESGYEQRIVEFRDGSEILELLDDEDKLAAFRRENFDPYLVILDINMPRVNGFDVANALDDWEREHGEQCWFVVLMLTSSANPRDMEKARDFAVIREFATKPLTSEALERAVAEAS